MGYVSFGLLSYVYCHNQDTCVCMVVHMVHTYVCIYINRYIHTPHMVFTVYIHNMYVHTVWYMLVCVFLFLVWYLVTACVCQQAFE